MAYKKSDLEKKALKAITENNLVFVTEIPTYLPCSERTFYDHKLQELQSIKDALTENKVRTKQGLRKKWYDSDNATVQIALYKLIGTKEESDRINSQKIDHAGSITLPITGMKIIKDEPGD